MFNYLIHKINWSIAESLPYHGTVIDLGCGTSPYKATILKKAKKYIGLDWLNSFHEQKNVDVFSDLSGGLPFINDCADNVVAFQVMEHLPETDLFLSECYRILKDNGDLFITVPFMWHVHEAPHDYYRFTRHGLEYLLKKHGFLEVDVQENTGFWQMLVLQFNYHTPRRFVFKLFLTPIWWFGQLISPYLDRVNFVSVAPVSYTARARKIRLD